MDMRQFWSRANLAWVVYGIGLRHSHRGRQRGYTILSTQFSSEQLWERASLRVASHMRSLWEEKGSSDTRLLESFFLPDAYTVVGRSVACDGKGHREHVIPRLVVVAECHRLLDQGATDDELAAFIREHTKIVIVSDDERRRLDHRSELGLRQRMPAGWVFGDDPFARLTAASVEWVPISTGLASMKEAP